MGTQLSEFFADRSFTACYFCIFCNMIQSLLKSAKMHPSISIQPQESSKLGGFKEIYKIRSR